MNAVFLRWFDLYAIHRWMIVALFFFIPFSRAATTILSIGIVVIFAFSGSWTARFQSIRQSPFTLPLMVLIAILVLGYTYSAAPATDKISHLQSYSRLIIVFVLIACLTDALWRKRCWYAFLAGCLFLLASSYVSIFYKLPWDKNSELGLGADHAVFANYLWQNVLLSFFACFCFFSAKCTTDRRFLYAWVAAGALTVFAIFFLAKGRTGQITFIFAAVTMMVMYFRRSSLVASLAVILTVVALSAINSNLVKSNFALAGAEIKTYVETGAHNNSSVGLRLHNWKTNFYIITKYPFIGQGSGSYKAIVATVFTDTETCWANCAHPHNQLMYFMFENGIVAFVVYWWLLVSMLIYGWKSARNSYSVLFAPFAVILFLHGLVDSPLVVSMDRAFYTGMMGLLAAGWVRQSDTTASA